MATYGGAYFLPPLPKKLPSAGADLAPREVGPTLSMEAGPTVSILPQEGTGWGSVFCESYRKKVGPTLSILIFWVSILHRFGVQCCTTWCANVDTPLGVLMCTPLRAPICIVAPLLNSAPAAAIQVASCIKLNDVGWGRGFVLHH